MALKREEQSSRTDEIVQKIKDFVLSGDLQPGDQLLPERELAKSLSVSRPSLREALRVLSGMGLIENTPRGTYVKKVTLGDVMEPLMLVMSQDTDDVSMLLEARKIIEVAVAKLAATRADEHNLVKLRDLANRFRLEVESGNINGQTDVEFHRQLVSACKNKVLMQLMVLVESLMKDHYAKIREQMMSQVAETFCNQHQKIYEAIRDRDPEQAASAAAEHIEFTTEQFLKLNEHKRHHLKS